MKPFQTESVSESRVLGFPQTPIKDISQLSLQKLQMNREGENSGIEINEKFLIEYCMMFLSVIQKQRQVQQVKGELITLRSQLKYSSGKSIFYAGKIKSVKSGGTEIFVCEYLECGKTFNQEVGLRTHMKTKHPVNHQIQTDS